MTLREDSATITRRRREKKTEYVIELPFGEPHAEYRCPECGETFRATILIPKDEPTFWECSAWECEAFLKLIDEGRSDRRSTGKNRALGAFATDGGTENKEN